MIYSINIIAVLVSILALTTSIKAGFRINDLEEKVLDLKSNVIHLKLELNAMQPKTETKYTTK